MMIIYCISFYLSMNSKKRSQFVSADFIFSLFCSFKRRSGMNRYCCESQKAFKGTITNWNGSIRSHHLLSVYYTRGSFADLWPHLTHLHLVTRHCRLSEPLRGARRPRGDTSHLPHLPCSCPRSSRPSHRAKEETGRMNKLFKPFHPLKPPPHPDSGVSTHGTRTQKHKSFVLI